MFIYNGKSYASIYELVKEEEELSVVYNGERYWTYKNPWEDYLPGEDAIRMSDGWDGTYLWFPEINVVVPEDEYFQN